MMTIYEERVDSFWFLPMKCGLARPFTTGSDTEPCAVRDSLKPMREHLTIS
jgi:hypothetical protein